MEEKPWSTREEGETPLHENVGETPFREVMKGCYIKTGKKRLIEKMNTTKWHKIIAAGRWNIIPPFAALKSSRKSKFHIQGTTEWDRVS